MIKKYLGGFIAVPNSVGLGKWIRKVGAVFLAVGYLFFVSLPILVLALLPGWLLQTGQGGEILANVSHVRVPAFIMCVAIPFLFLMFCSAARILIPVAGRLPLTEWWQKFLIRFHCVIACILGFLATSEALLPFYTYRREYGLAVMFDGGFVGRGFYEVGVVLMLLLSVWVYTDWRIQVGSARRRLVINIGSRVVYVGTAVLVYVISERIRGRELTACAFFIAVLVVSTIIHPINGARKTVPGVVPDLSGARQWAKIYLRGEWHTIVLATLILGLFAIYPSVVGLLLGSLLVLIAGIGAWVVLVSVMWATALVTRNRGPKAVSLAMTVGGLLFICMRSLIHAPQSRRVKL